MRRKDVIACIVYALAKQKETLFSMITFHLDNGLTVVTPIILTIYSHNRQSMRIRESIQDQTIDRIIPFNKINMVVLS